MNTDKQRSTSSPALKGRGQGGGSLSPLSGRGQGGGSLLFGGSFNPIHVGHIALARQVLAQGLASEVWFNVSPRNPLKAADGLADDQLRLQMVEQAIADEPGMKACDIEFSLPRPSYTWHTLEALWAKYPDREFSLLIGADNWALFPQWYRHAEILSRCRLIVYPREGYPLDAANLPDDVTLLQTELYPVSSTQIRQRVAQGQSIHGMVPEAIEREVVNIYRRLLGRQYSD